MSVNQDKIDFKAIREAASKKVSSSDVEQRADNIDFKAIREKSVKKKEPAPSATTPPASSTGAATPISTLPLNDPTKPFDFTPKWETVSEEEANYKGFKENDKQTLSGLLQKHGVTDDPLSSIRANLGMPQIPGVKPQVSTRPFIKEYEAATALENEIKNKAGQTTATAALDADLEEAQNLKKKLAREIVIEGADDVTAIVGTDQSGNNLKKTFNRLLAMNPISAPIAGGAISMEVQDEIKKLPSQFTTGLNYIKLVEPVEYERVLDALKNGNRLSATQVATITSFGIDIEEERLGRDISLANKNLKSDTDRFANIQQQLDSLKPAIQTYEDKVKQLQLSPQEISDYKNKINQYNSLVKEAKPLQEKISDVMGGYSKKAEQISKVKLDNILNNDEVLRALLSDGIAEMGDEIGKATQAGSVLSPQKQIADYLFGHTWNYSDDEIKRYGESYAKQNGLDPASPQVQKAIKYLQDNEGWMIMDNSIAKAGGIREFFKGAAEPIRGISNTIEDLGRSSNDVYAEAQSQGNVNVSEKRLKAEDTGVRGVINEVLKGTGQFATQAGIMALTSGGIGMLAEGIAGKAGAEMLAAARAANIKPSLAFGDDTANLILSNTLTKVKNPLSVFTTSYAMASDSNLKQALQYTSDNSLAKKAAFFNSTVDALTELVLSPLDIATGIVNKFTKGQTKDLLKILSDKSLSQNKLKEFATKIIDSKLVKGTTSGGKVALTEIGEEWVSNLADYATNAYLNPNSETFKNRDLGNELMHTAYQTGLTMAIPALLNGIGSARANSFSKGSLLVAAQNRQRMIDAYKQDFATGKIDQNQLNANISLVNTAAQANAEIPKKADGTALTTNEKADYVFSRVTEAMLQNKANTVKDAAEKQILSKKILEQQNYRAAILGNEKVEEDPVYKVDGNEVTQSQFVQMATDENSDDHTFEVENDDATKAQFQKIVEVDKSETPPAEQTKNEDIELLKTLKGKPTVFEFEYNAMVANPELALREVADQALGFTRSEGKRVPHEFGAQEKQTREKYGDAVVDRAIELYPDESINTDGEKNEGNIPLTIVEKKNWDSLSLEEKRKLAVENLPELDEGITDKEVVELADKNAKYLLAKMRGEEISRPVELSIDNPAVPTKEISTNAEGGGKDVVDELPVAEKAAAKKVAPAEKKAAAPSEPKAKSKLAKFKEKHLSKPAEQPLTNTVSEGKTNEQVVEPNVGENAQTINESSKKAIDNFIEGKTKSFQYLEDSNGLSLSLGDEHIANAVGTKLSEVKDGDNQTSIKLNSSEVKEYRKIEADRELGDITTEEYNAAKRELAKRVFNRILSEQSSKEVKQENKPLNETTQEPIKADEPVLTEEERQKRIQSLTEEKQQKVNEVTKPEISFDTGLSLTDLAGTSEANRQLHDDYKSQLASLKNIINCLWQ